MGPIIPIGKTSASLEDLVAEGYLRQVPRDLMNTSNQTWRVAIEETPAGGANSTPGIYDVKSGSDKRVLDGTSYSDW